MKIILVMSLTGSQLHWLTRLYAYDAFCFPIFWIIFFKTSVELAQCVRIVALYHFSHWLMQLNKYRPYITCFLQCITRLWYETIIIIVYIHLFGGPELDLSTSRGRQLWLFGVHRTTSAGVIFASWSLWSVNATWLMRLMTLTGKVIDRTCGCRRGSNMDIEVMIIADSSFLSILICAMLQL